MSEIRPLRWASVRALSLAIGISLAAGAFAQSNYSIVWDDFKGGYTANSPTAKWFSFGIGPYVGNDGIETTSNQGLNVRSASTNPTTGLPAYSLTLGQEGDPIDNPFGLPGGVDHVKWLIYANHLSTAGFPGFDANMGEELRFDSWISGRSFGNELHPFGTAVADPDDDIRLACSSMPTIDFENFLVADFFLTNKRIYALYERLPFARTPFDNYAAFTYAVPVGTRQPHQQHKLSIAYDRAANAMRWLVDDIEVFRVDRPGYRLPSRQHMIIDHGGVDTDVTCRQRNVGFGIFTLLDAAYPGQPGLVKLSTAPNFYFATGLGEPTPQTFIDNSSLRASRVWGAGVELNIRRVRISSR